MTLQYKINSLEGLDENIQKLYAEKDGEFVLDVTGHEKTEDNKDKIPLSRLNKEIEKRKLSETQMKEIADSYIEEIPEDFKDLIPDLPPAEKIKWIKSAQKKGVFQAPSEIDSPDSKRPGGNKPPANYENMSPQAIMAQGYKTK